MKKKFKAFDTLHSKVGDRIRINVENMTLTTPFLGKNLNYISESESADHVTVSSIRGLRAITTMTKIVNILFSNPIQKRFCLSRFLTNHLEQEFTVILEPCHSLGLQSRFSGAGGNNVT